MTSPPGRRTLAPLGRRGAAVEANEAVGAYRLITVVDRDGPASPQPGQFYMLSTPAGWGGLGDERPYLPRAFSFARVLSGGSGAPRLQFLLEAIGPGTERLGEAAAGEQMLLTGPLGLGFAAPPRGPSGAILVGGGIGAAPILAWQDRLEGLARGGARPLLGFRSGVYAEAARMFAGDPAVATDDGSAGRHGLVTELLREELDARGADAPTVYACGPPAMLEAVRALCEEREVAAQLALESGMACGFGACFGCVVPTRDGFVRLCVDGPVLDAAALGTADPPSAVH